MASKFHINSSGDVRVCNATVRPCKFGEEAHFTDRAEARKAVETKLEEEHGVTAPSIKAPKATVEPSDSIDQNKLKEIRNVSSETYERAVRSMKDRSKTIAKSAGLSSYNTSEYYVNQVSELPKTVREAEAKIFANNPLSHDEKELLDNAVASFSKGVNEAIDCDWDDSDKMVHIERSAASLSTTFRNLVKARGVQ